jgi:threonine/homoserine/homoserine lactone efflux protein
MVMAVGFGALCLEMPMLRQVIQIVGTLYLLYLSFQIATSHMRMRKKVMHQPLTFMHAFLFQWVNPKAWVMMMSAISAYTSFSGPNPYLELFIIVVTRFFMITMCCGLWVVGGSKLKSFFTNDRYQAWFNYGMGALLALSVIPLLF